MVNIFRQKVVKETGFCILALKLSRYFDKSVNET